MMALDLARALDPCLIAHDVGITPDQWQADLLRSTALRLLLLCARQTGKTTTTGIIALGTALYKPALADADPQSIATAIRRDAAHRHGDARAPQGCAGTKSR